MPQSHSLKLCLASLCLALSCPLAHAATWVASAVLSAEGTTKVKPSGNTHKAILEQDYTFAYEATVFQDLDLGLEFGLEVEHIENDPGITTKSVTPSVDVALAGQWWELNGFWEEIRTTGAASGSASAAASGSATGARRPVKMEWEFEAVVEPEFEALPAFKYNVKGGSDDITDGDVDLVFEYTFLDELDVFFGLSRVTADRPEPDRDTDERIIETKIKLTHDVTRAIRLEADWISDRDQILLLSDDREILQRRDLLENDVRALLEWDILEVAQLGLEKKVEWDKNLELDILEVKDTWIGDAEYDQEFNDALHLNLTYRDQREDARFRLTRRGTYTVTRDYTGSLEFTPFEWLSVSPTFDRNDKTQQFDAAGTGTADILKDTYEVPLEYALWGEFLVLEVIRTWDFTWEEGSKTKEKRSWDVGLEFTPLYIPNLEILPTYRFKQNADPVTGISLDEETIAVEIGYELSVNDRLIVTLDHTYSRLQKWPSGAKMSIKRTDDTDLVLTWDEFLRGMAAELSLSRAATDTSGDDKEAKVDYTYSATYDWEILARYALGFEYNRDIKRQALDTRDFTTTISAEFHGGRILVDFEHEFKERLEGDKEKTHRYLIELTGEF